MSNCDNNFTLRMNSNIGLPHKAINCIELAASFLGYIQKRFHKDFAPGKKEVY
jgi:hypothetical protein